MIAANVPSLPDGDSPDLVLVPATPKERIESIKLNSVAWKGPLDIDSYIAREDHLYNQRLTRENLTCWILVDRSEPEGERTILSSESGVFTVGPSFGAKATRNECSRS